MEWICIPQPCSKFTTEYTENTEISDDPRKARYVRTLLDAVMQDERLAGDLVLVAAPLEEEDDGEQN